MIPVVALALAAHLQAAPVPGASSPPVHTFLAAVPAGWRDPRTGCVYPAPGKPPECPK